MEQLKPCAHCGGAAKLHSEYDDGFHSAWVICPECGTHTQTFYRGDTERYAVCAWNRRAYEEAVEKMLRLVPVSICIKFCKNASPHCGRWGECRPEWNGK